MRAALRSLAIVLGSCLAAPPASAEVVDRLRAAAASHFAAQLVNETCAQFFRYAGTEVANWTSNGASARIEIMFRVEYISDKALYGVSTRTLQCLGGVIGEAFFERGKSYRTPAFVYSLSLWAAGWHVDRIDLQP